MTTTYHAMVLEQNNAPLYWRTRTLRSPASHEAVIKVRACAVCRTDLHLMDAELPDISYPIVPGHEIVGEIVAVGHAVNVPLGTRVGIPWLGSTCQHCDYCRRGQENLCPQARFNGYQLDGGYAEYVIVRAAYMLPLPERYGDAEAAPLLCAGLIGYRTYAMALEQLAGREDQPRLKRRIGIYGFGAAAHIISQIAIARGHEVYALTRPGDTASQKFARDVGAVWAGGSDLSPPAPLDAALIFAPIGALAPTALRAVRPGGVVVCGGIHMSDIPSFPYADLWGERTICSVANLTRRDGESFMRLAAEIPLQTHIETMPLKEANEALARLRRGAVAGALVLVP